MAITSVIGTLESSTSTFTYNSETGYYEGELIAPSMISVLNTPNYYIMNITATSDVSPTKNIEVYIFVIPDFIYDRTRGDVDLVKRLREKYLNDTITASEIETYATDLKGALNRSDLERNEFNITCISKLLDLGLITKYNIDSDTYSIDELPNENYFEDLLDNVIFIYNEGYHYRDTPLPPEQPLNYYMKWNDIERILHDAFYVALSTVESGLYCGDSFYSGEVITLL